jgi:hypothetical protein
MGVSFWSRCWLEGLRGEAICIYLVDNGETRWHDAMGFCDGRGLMDLRKTVAMSGIVMALKAGLARSMR